MKTYISVNIVAQSLILINSIRNNNCYLVPLIRQLKLPYGVNYESAYSFAKQCMWINENASSIAFTERGLVVAKKFHGDSISKDLWRTILFDYISVCQPAWAKRIPYGRKEAYLFMNEEEQRCFSEADLINSQDDEVVQWWDNLAEIERMKKSASLDDIGRKGERLTMDYEKNRTGVCPDWRSIETNLSGYDILSRRSENDGEQLLIEVKSSSMPITDAVAIISRHEWDTATLSNNLNRYLFYFWNLNAAQNQLAIVSVEEMRKHLPIDGDLGMWENVKVPFKAFSEKFKMAS